MQENRENGFVFYCDGCSNSIDTRENNFFSAIAIIKQSGWKIVKKEEDWLHLCSEECKSK